MYLPFSCVFDLHLCFFNFHSNHWIWWLGLTVLEKLIYVGCLIAKGFHIAHALDLCFGLLWYRDGMSIVLSDEVGQIFIIATGQGESQKDAQYDQVHSNLIIFVLASMLCCITLIWFSFIISWQFFLGDYRPLIQDTHGNFLDQVFFYILLSNVKCLASHGFMTIRMLFFVSLIHDVNSFFFPFYILH